MSMHKNYFWSTSKQTPGSAPRDAIGMRWDLSIYISNKLPSEVDTAIVREQTSSDDLLPPPRD